MKKISLIVVFVTMVLAASAYAENVRVGVMANGEVVATDLDFLGLTPYGTISGGVGISYDEDDYTIGNGSVALQSENMVPGLRYGLGFKYVRGDVEKRTHATADLSALAFLFAVDYELSADINPTNVPMEFSFQAAIAPGSLSFQNTDSYQEFSANLRFYMLENAYISLKYTYLDFEFDAVAGDWDRTDKVTTGGIVLKF